MAASLYFKRSSAWAEGDYSRPLARRGIFHGSCNGIVTTAIKGDPEVAFIILPDGCA